MITLLNYCLLWLLWLINYSLFYFILFYCVLLCFSSLSCCLAGWLAGWRSAAGCRVQVPAVCHLCASHVPAESARSARGQHSSHSSHTTLRVATCGKAGRSAECSCSVWKQPADRPPADRSPVTCKNKQPGGRERGSQAKPGVNVAKNAWSWSWWWSWSRIWAEQAKEEEEAQREWLWGAGDSAVRMTLRHRAKLATAWRAPQPEMSELKINGSYIVQVVQPLFVVYCLLSIVCCYYLLIASFLLFVSQFESICWLCCAYLAGWPDEFLGDAVFCGWWAGWWAVDVMSRCPAVHPAPAPAPCPCFCFVSAVFLPCFCPAVFFFFFFFLFLFLII